MNEEALVEFQITYKGKVYALGFKATQAMDRDTREKMCRVLGNSAFFTLAQLFREVKET